MKCPTCDADLVLSERQGVEIDYCPKCRGVWLDRGELDKIIERADRYRDDDRREEYRQQEDRHQRSPDYRELPRRKSFWSELFD